MLERFYHQDLQQEIALKQQEAAFLANDIANIIAAELLLDAPETSKVMSLIYRAIVVAQETISLHDDIPF